MEKMVATNNADEMLDDYTAEEIQPKSYEEKLPVLRSTVGIKGFIMFQVILIDVVQSVLTDLVVVLSVLAKTMLLLILRAFYAMIPVPAKSPNTYYENERVLIIGGTNELGKEIALQLARFNVNRITLWDTNTEQLNVVTDEIKQLNSSSTIFTYTLPSLNKESVLDTITKMKFEAGDISLLVNAIDNNNIDINEKILTTETDSLLNIIQQELMVHTMVRCDKFLRIKKAILFSRLLKLFYQ